ncbi:MAG: AMP-binding protein [Planctomycetota bacterium]
MHPERIPTPASVRLLDEFLSRSAERRADRSAMVVEDHRVDYGQLDAHVNRLAHALVDAGVERGDRVAVYLQNSLETVVSVFGILRAGAAFVVVNPTTPVAKLSFLLNDSAARAVVLPRDATPALDAIVSDVPSVRALVTCGDGDAPAHTTLREIRFAEDLSDYAASPPSRRGIDMDLAAIIYTSGTTGRPKGVTLTHRNLISAAESITEYLENVPDDIILNVLPMSFDYGLYQALMAPVVGATLVLEKSFAYPYRIVQRIREEEVTGFPGVPTIFASLLSMKDLDPAEFDSVRYVTNTGAALATSHITRLKSLFRNARIYSMYGITECKRVSYMPPDELEARPDSVGRGMPNEEVWIVDEHGEPVAPGQVGELVVRGSNVMQGYWNLPEETEKVLRPGRHPWEKVLHTGDLFSQDEEGYLYFFSRTDDIIKSRGQKVSPKEVEAAFYELPEVREVAVVGEPDPILGQAIKAFVVLADGSELTEREILRHCARHLESFMVPQHVEICDRLPHTTSGKIRRPVSESSEAAAPERVCSRCVLPETFPGVQLDEDGVCGFCRRPRKPAMEEAARDRALAKFEDLLSSVRERPGPHCVLALSGGKDSTYTLLELRERFGLDAVAVTFDNGFLSEHALANARRAVEALDAEHILVRPRFGILKELFSRAALDSSCFSPKALERASGVCNACVALVKGVVMRTAIEREIPIVAFGWSPGQAPVGAAVFRMNAEMLRTMHDTRCAPVVSLVPEGLEPFLLEERHFEDPDRLPYSVNPLALLPYDEKKIIEEIGRVGWTQPTDTDGNSTNCRLNALANHVHLNRLGYHPYALEMAGMVRMGIVDREEALEKLRDAGDRATIEEVARELGVPELAT